MLFVEILCAEERVKLVYLVGIVVDSLCGQGEFLENRGDWWSLAMLFSKL